MKIQNVIPHKGVLWLPVPFLFFGLSGEFAPNLVALIASTLIIIIFSIYEVFNKKSTLWPAVLAGGWLLSLLALLSPSVDDYRSAPDYAGVSVFLGIVFVIYYIGLRRRK